MAIWAANIPYRLCRATVQKAFDAVAPTLIFSLAPFLFKNSTK